MSQLLLDNAIGWVHFRLLGGRSRLFWIVGMFTILAIAALMVPATVIGAPAGYLLNGFVGFELVISILIAPTLTSNAIRRDVKERMIESHRLMPVSGPEAIVGYLIGPNAIPICLFLGSIVFGSIAAAESGVIIPRFLIASGIVLSFATFLTIFAAFGSFGSANSGGIWLIFAVAPIFSNNPNLGHALPAAAIFGAPFMRKTVFSMQAGVDEPLAYAISELFQLLMGILFFIGAQRRYRAPQKPGFTPLMGMATVAIWTAASVIGIAHWDLFRWQTFGSDRVDQNLQWTVAASIGLFIAATPVLLCDRLRFVWNLRRRLNPDLPEKPPMPGTLVALCCATMVVLLGPLALPQQATFQNLALVATIVLAFLFSIRYWDSLFRRMHVAGLTLAALAATWGGPPLLVLTLEWLAVLPSSPAGILANPICACSTPVALYDVWGAPKNPILWGIVFQVMLAVTGAMLAYGRQLRRGRRRVHSLPR